MARRAKKETPEEKLLKEAKERFKIALDAWDDNRKAWLEDVKFAAGEQWPDEIKKIRQVPGKERPCLTVDKLGQYIRQVVNDGRQNRPSVKVRPVMDGDVKVAEAFQGIIRHIWDKSNADQAADTALEHAVKGGFGYIRLTTEYAYNSTFDQEICIKRVRNPLCVLLDPNFQEADGSDARFGFVIDEIPKDEFKAQYPKAKFTDWEYDAKKYSDEWLPDGNVRVVEYFYKIDAPEIVHLLEDGTTVCDEDYQRDTANQQAIDPSYQPPAIVESREIPDCEVKWCRLTGAEILEQNDWLGKYIPIIPVFGNEEDIDGKVIYSGLIRKAKDAQRLYNFSRSAFAERVALSPKAPFVGADEAVADFIDDWESANTSNTSILRYRHLDEAGNPIPPPQRQAPSDVPAGFAQDAQMAEHDIQASLGMYAASVGQPSNEKSGKAILARQREGDVSTFHYQDNQSRAIGYLGVQLVDLIPKIIDSKRAIRLLEEDGQATPAMVDPDQDEPVMKGPEGILIYKLNAGQYDVSVSSGPSYTTKRQEAVEAMMQLTQSAPQFLQVAGDIMVRNMDWPGAQEIADRLKKMLPPQLQDDANGEESPEVGAVKAHASQIIQQLQGALQQTQQQMQGMAQEMQRLKDAHDIKAAEANVKQQHAETEDYDAVTRRISAVQPALGVDPQGLQALIQQTVREALMTVLNEPTPKPPAEPEGMPVMPPPSQPQAPSGAFLTPGA